MSDIIAQAIRQVLADSDVKKAVLDYLKSMTKEEWRKIYRRQGEEVRYIFEAEDRFTGVKNVYHPVRMFVTVDYNEKGGVGRVFCMVRHTGYFEGGTYLYEGDYRYTTDEFQIAEEALIVQHPGEVIDYVFVHWEAWLAKFRTLTLPTNEKETVSA